MNDNIELILANINGKVTVLYDGDTDNISEVLETINETMELEFPAYTKQVDRRKYLEAKDNAVSLMELVG